MSARIILSSICLLTLTIFFGTVWAKEAKDSVLKATPAFRPVIEFGHQGGNLRPYRIGIDAGGQVKVLAGSPHLKADHIPAEKVQELLQMASDESFWKSTAADDARAQKMLPDFGFVFVRVHVTGQRAIYHRGRQTGPLGKFYTELSDLVLA